MAWMNLRNLVRTIAVPRLLLLLCYHPNFCHCHSFPPHLFMLLLVISGATVFHQLPFSYTPFSSSSFILFQFWYFSYTFNLNFKTKEESNKERKKIREEIQSHIYYIWHSNYLLFTTSFNNRQELNGFASFLEILFQKIT